MYLACSGETPPSHILNSLNICVNYKNFGPEASLLDEKNLRCFWQELPKEASAWHRRMVYVLMRSQWSKLVQLSLFWRPRNSCRWGCSACRRARLQIWTRQWTRGWWGSSWWRRWCRSWTGRLGGRQSAHIRLQQVITYYQPMSQRCYLFNFVNYAAILRLSLPSFDEFALTEHVDVFWCRDMKKFQKGGPCVPVVNRCHNWRNASWACFWTRGKVSIDWRNTIANQQISSHGTWPNSAQIWNLNDLGHSPVAFVLLQIPTFY